ncbi:hypothetical protein [Haliscomenobacter sp.]|uniref:hypothetical protein n=1 Tax=Haliscomenobacter sp. TaxID=2717303 RepID=UPI003BAC40C5
MLNKSKLQTISTTKYPFNFSGYFGHGLHLFGREAGQFVGYTLIHLLLFLLVRTFAQEAIYYLLVVLPSFLSGYYIVARDIDQDEDVPFSRFFAGYYHAPGLLVIGGIILLGCGILSIPFLYFEPGVHLVDWTYTRFLIALYLTLGAYPLLLPVVFFYSFFRWAPMLYLFSKMSIPEALIMSWKLVKPRWFLHFLFTIVLAIIGAHFSMYLFYVLSLFLVGVTACIDYASFAQITEEAQEKVSTTEDSEPEAQPEPTAAALIPEKSVPPIAQLPVEAPRAVASENSVIDTEDDLWHVPDEKEVRTKFELLLNRKSRLDIKGYFGKSFRLFSDDIGNFIPYTFVVLFTLLLTRLVGSVGIIANMLLANQLIAGYFVAGASLERGHKKGIGTYFAAFEFVQTIGLFSLIQFLVNFILFLPFLFTVGRNLFRFDLIGHEAYPYWSFLLLVPLIYLSMAWRWAPALMIFYHMRLWEAMETSRKLISRNIFGQLIHVLLITLPLLIPIIVNLLGVSFQPGAYSLLFLLLIGYSFGADYFAFADEVDLFEETDSEKLDLLDHFIETKE